MAVYYRVYIGSWLSSDSIIISVPNETTDNPAPDSTKRSMGDTLAHYPWFDFYTMFYAGTDAYNILNGLNWPDNLRVDVSDYTSTNRLRLFFSETKVVDLWNAGNYVAMYAVSSSTLTSSGKPGTFISPADYYRPGYPGYKFKIGINQYNVSDHKFNLSVSPVSGGTLGEDFWDDIEPVRLETDPYLPDGVTPAGEGGGTGTFSETGDTIGIPGLPALSAVDTGFITLFNPSAAQVKSLAAYMWSSSFDLATFKNIVANPIDCILGLTIVPVDPPNAGSKTVSVGNIPTDVTLPYLSSQYVEVDCGTLNVQEFWGSYLDYSPYTKMSLYLPYIGIIPLDIDDVMNASIAVKYHVDVLSGACVAYVLCNGTQLYTYVGQCSSNVPITSNDFTNTVNGILGIAGSIGKLAADGGASAPTEAAGIAANAINALKPNIQKSGAMSGTGGLMGVQTPYLICQRPRQSVPASQNTFTGYPANITAKLSDLSGYTEVDSIHLDGLSATQEEQQEIMDLLTSGVII